MTSSSISAVTIKLLQFGAYNSVNIANSVHTTRSGVYARVITIQSLFLFAEMALSVALPRNDLETENFNSYNSFGHIIEIAGLAKSQTSPSPSVSSESSGIGSLGSLKSESVNSDSLPSSPQTTEKVRWKCSHYFVCICPGLDLSIFIIFRNGEQFHYAINNIIFC
jgi:hypothetical protein